MRGIMFTAMIAMIALSILSLATVYLVYTTNTNAALDKTVVFYTMTEEYNDIERLVSEVLRLHNYSFDIDESNATVNYLFPSSTPDTRNGLNGNISFLWAFMENLSDFGSDINLSYLNGSDTHRGNLSLRFFPERTTFDSIGGIGSDRIEVRNSENVVKYEIHIDAHVTGIMGTGNGMVEHTGDDWPVRVKVTGETESNVYDNLYDQVLEGDENSTVNITVNQDSFVFNLSSLSGDHRTLTVHRFGNPETILTIKPSFNISDMVEVWLDKETINMTVSQYNIKKLGNIRVG